jgi:hypothetical protein
VGVGADDSRFGVCRGRDVLPVGADSVVVRECVGR